MGGFPVLGDSVVGRSPFMISVTKARMKKSMVHCYMSFRNNAWIGIGSIMKNYIRVYSRPPSDDNGMVDLVVSNVLHTTNF